MLAQKCRLEGLADLLEFDGLRDQVLSFVDARDVGRVAATCKRARDAVEDEQGKLRAVNLSLKFICRPRLDGMGHRVPKPLDLCPIYSRLHIQSLQRLGIEIDINRDAHVDADVDADGMTIDMAATLGQIHSLLGKELHQFRVYFLNGKTQKPLQLHFGAGGGAASSSTFNHFATTLAALPVLEEVWLTSALAELPVAVSSSSARSRAGAADFFPRLRRLKVIGRLKLQDLTRDALLYRAVVCVPTSTSSEGIANAGHVRSSSSTVTASTTTLTHCSGRKLEAFVCNLTLAGLQLKQGPGVEFWRSAVSPSTKTVGISLLYDREKDDAQGEEEEEEDDEAEDGQRDRFQAAAKQLWDTKADAETASMLWKGAVNVQNLIINHIPAQQEWLQHLPSLQTLCVWDEPAFMSKRMRRPHFVFFFDSCSSLRSLAFRKTCMSSPELGWLAARMADKMSFLPGLSANRREEIARAFEKCMNRNTLTQTAYRITAGTTPLLEFSTR